MSVSPIKIALVNPLWSFKNELPTNLAELAGYIREHGYPDISLIDLNYELKKHIALDDMVGKAVEIVRGRKPDVIGITCNTIHVPFCVEFCKSYKKRYQTPIVLGGVHPTFRPDRMLKLSGADYIVRGEGEETFLELLDAVRQKGRFENIRGLSYRDNNRIRHNPDRPLIEDLSKLPFPAFDLLRPYKREDVGIIRVCASRGCPYGCIFCSANKMWGYQRRKPVERVIEEIKYLKKKYRCRHIQFSDDCLPLNKAWFDALLSEIRKLKLTWLCCSRMDILDQALLKRARDSGCNTIYHGIESGSPRIRALLDKKLRLKVDNTYICELVRKELSMGFEVFCSFMVGVPTETEEEIRQTAGLALRLKGLGAIVQFWIMTPYPDTKATVFYKKDLARVDRWKTIRQSDIYKCDQFYLYSGFYERYRRDNPDFYLFKPDMELEDFLKLYAEERKRLGLQGYGRKRLYNYIKETHKNIYFVGPSGKSKLKYAADIVASGAGPNACANCHKLFKINKDNQIELCCGKRLFKADYADDREFIFYLFCRLGSLGLKEKKGATPCPDFPKDKKSFARLWERYGLGLRNKEAIDELRAAEKLFPGDPQINVLLLKCYTEAGMAKESEREFLKAYENARNFSRKRPNLL